MAWSFTTTQLRNAALICGAAEPFGREAAKAALMTALAESSLLMFANDGSTTRADVPVKWRVLAATSMAYPHDAVAGSAWTTADSVGLYQQRAMYGYGTIAELMDPAESTRIFIRGSKGGTGTTRYFLQSPADLSIAARCQWTQGSEFPTGENYAPMELPAIDLLNRFLPARAVAETQLVKPTPDPDWTDMATADEFRSIVHDEIGAPLAAFRQDVLGWMQDVEKREQEKLAAFRADTLGWLQDVERRLTTAVNADAKK